MDFLTIAQLIITVVAFGYLVFWKDYMKAKGKNVATVEDIEKITKLTGEIKNEIALSKESQISFQSLRREAIINYYDILTHWCNFLQSLTIEDHIDYRKIEDELKAFENNYYNALSRLTLFDEDFDKYKSLINQMTNALSTIDVNYRWKLGSYLSIKNNMELLVVRRREFYDLRSHEIERFSSQLIEITKIFRQQIKARNG